MTLEEAQVRINELESENKILKAKEETLKKEKESLKRELLTRTKITENNIKFSDVFK